MEELLSSSLKELGVTEEQFISAVMKSKDPEVNKLVFGQILAADDFLSTLSTSSLPNCQTCRFDFQLSRK